MSFNKRAAWKTPEMVSTSEKMLRGVFSHVVVIKAAYSCFYTHPRLITSFSTCVTVFKRPCLGLLFRAQAKIRRLMRNLQVWGGVVGANGLVPGQESSDFYSALYNDHVSSAQRIRYRPNLLAIVKSPFLRRSSAVVLRWYITDVIHTGWSSPGQRIHCQSARAAVLE